MYYLFLLQEVDNKLGNEVVGFEDCTPELDGTLIPSVIYLITVSPAM